MTTNPQELPVPSLSKPSRSRAAFLTATVLIFYAVFVLLLWAPFAFRTGMPSETYFAYLSETRNWHQGFFYPYDSLRIYSAFFFHVSYLLSELLGIRGSYLGYQIVYALLWWARGVMVYLIARRLWPAYPLFQFLLGTLLIFHLSDRGTTFLGMINQVGVLFFMFTSFYLLLRALQAKSWWAGFAWVIVACFFSYMSLWSYESQIILICVMPLMFMALCGWRLKNILVSGVYWIVPAVYAYLTYIKYETTASTYQQRVMRPQVSSGQLLLDLLFNIKATFSFWNWGPATRDAITPKPAIVLSIAAAMVVTLALWMVHRLSKPRMAHRILPNAKSAAGLLVAGLALTALSFPAYLLLRAVRTLWRTQYFSAPGAALSVAAAIALIAALSKSRRWTAVILPLIVLPWVYFGTFGAYELGEVHYRLWHVQQTMMESILQSVPSVKDGTVFVLTDVPRLTDNPADPFQNEEWLDLTLRLAYPGKKIDTIYYYADGTFCKDGTLFVEGTDWKSHGGGWQPMLPTAKFADTIVLKFINTRVVLISYSVPSYVTTNPAALSLYHPEQNILSDPPSPIAVRRYLRGHFPETPKK